MGYEGRLTPEVNMEVYEEVDAKEAEAYKEDAEEYKEADGGGV